MSLLSALEGQAKLLRSNLLNMASFRLEETVQPLRDVVASMQGWMLWIVSFLKRAKAALDRLSLTSPMLQSTPELHPLDVPDVGLVEESGATFMVILSSCLGQLNSGGSGGAYHAGALGDVWGTCCASV
jgi:hypothetical protein